NRDEQTLTACDRVVDANLATDRVGDDHGMPIGRHGQPIGHAKAAQGVDGTSRIRVDDDDDAVAVASDPDAFAVRTDGDPLNELGNGNDMFRLTLRNVQATDRSIDDVGGEQLVAA